VLGASGSHLRRLVSSTRLRQLEAGHTVKQWQFAILIDENDYKPVRGFRVVILDNGNVKHFIEIVCHCSLLGDHNHHAASEY
jgi:hypothetical protein